MEFLMSSPLLPLLGVGFHHPSILALELISVFIRTRRFIAGEFVDFSSLFLPLYVCFVSWEWHESISSIIALRLLAFGQRSIWRNADFQAIPTTWGGEFSKIRGIPMFVLFVAPFRRKSDKNRYRGQ
jgi:hypothetical protein